jgi:hypothetical protein
MNTTNQKRINSSERKVGLDVVKDTLVVGLFELDLHSQAAKTDRSLNGFSNIGSIRLAIRRSLSQLACSS